MIPTEMAGALIGFASAVAGALIKTYAEELKALVSGRFTTNKDLLGHWECVWTVDDPRKESDISDTVTVKNIAGEKIFADAHTPRVGSYRLVGRLSASYLVTFTYAGLAERHPLGGGDHSPVECRT